MRALALLALLVACGRSHPSTIEISGPPQAPDPHLFTFVKVIAFAPGENGRPSMLAGEHEILRVSPDGAWHWAPGVKDWEQRYALQELCDHGYLPCRKHLMPPRLNAEVMQ